MEIINNIVFTLCSKNYLSHAITLYQSFKIVEPDTNFFIGVVDELTEIEKNELSNYNYLLCSDINIDVFSDMCIRYNIVELNTAVKPYFIKYFFEKYSANKVIYLDPDIYVYESIKSIFDKLNSYSFILTPHFTTPIYDDKHLSEQVALVSGNFNLGFFAIRNDQVGKSLIDWWARKLEKECIMNHELGYFVDQKWMNLSVCHFNNYLIDKDLGLNVAHWNLHERRISKDNNHRLLINEKFPLLFFHFSSFKPLITNQIAEWQNRFDFKNRPDIENLFDDYREKLFQNGYNYYSLKTPALGKLYSFKLTRKQKFKNRIINIINKI